MEREKVWEKEIRWAEIEEKEAEKKKEKQRMKEREREIKNRSIRNKYRCRLSTEFQRCHQNLLSTWNEIFSTSFINFWFLFASLEGLKNVVDLEVQKWKWEKTKKKHDFFWKPPMKLLEKTKQNKL